MVPPRRGGARQLAAPGVRVMRAYAYQEPSHWLLKFVRRRAVMWPFVARLALACLLAACWAVLAPACWLCVKLGDAGHAVGGWAGLDTREW